MSKLWIVHPRPTVRAALARATGVPASAIAAGGPSLAAFEPAARPVAVLMALTGGREAELAFAQAVRRRAPEARWILVCPADEVDAIRRRFDALGPRVLPIPPDRMQLRAAVARALRPRDPRAAESLAERVRRVRTADRFDAWLGATTLPGLTRALDPGLRRLPLLVRGRPGSGRSLLVQHAEAARGGSRRALRWDGRAVGGLEAIVARLRSSGPADRPVDALWIDEIDALPASDQRALADWIVHGIVPPMIPDECLAADLRWLATADAPEGARRMDASLARAFVPLTLVVPPLPRTPEAIERIAARAAREWADATGTSPRRFADSALHALADSPLWAERAELEAILRASLAATDAAELAESDLSDPEELTAGPAASELHGEDAIPADEASESHDGPGADAAERSKVGKERSDVGKARDEVEEARSEAGEERCDVVEDAWPSPRPELLSLDPDADPSSALLGLTGPWTNPGEDPEAGDWEDEREREERVEGDAPETEPALHEPLPPAPLMGDPTWRRLARSLSHEIRNPLVSIRTFTELLPEHYGDETFRTRFKEFVGKDVSHIQEVVSRLAKATERDRFESIPVDVSALIDRVLGTRRDAIAKRRQVVLSELERDAPFALGDPAALETALDGLVDRALASLPDRGDLFITTRRISRAADGRPRLRVLLRHHNPQASGLSGELDPVAQILEYVLAETIVGALGGRLTIDPTLGPETLIVIDLPTP